VPRRAGPTPTGRPVRVHLVDQVVDQVDADHLVDQDADQVVDQDADQDADQVVDQDAEQGAVEVMLEVKTSLPKEQVYRDCGPARNVRGRNKSGKWGRAGPCALHPRGIVCNPRCQPERVVVCNLPLWSSCTRKRSPLPPLRSAERGGERSENQTGKPLKPRPLRADRP
jgi:hypothetical protein